MYRYLTRLRELHPNLKEGYIDWMAQQTAVTIGTDPVETKAALLGFPHDHSAHTDTVLKDISSEGCSTDAATKNGEQIAEEHSLHDASEKFERFTVNDQSTDAAIIFTVMESEVAFTDYGISHEKEMHLIVVRDDLRHFFHIHPERDANGIWSVPFTPSSGGTYRIYADFVDDEVHHHTLLFDRTYTGDHGIEGFIHNVDTQKSVGPFTVSFDDAPSEHGILLSFHVRDGNGNAPVFEPYLGTSAHGILLSPSGDFIHTHPSLANDTITLYVENPKDDLYRVFTQFQVQGKLYTTEFDWEPKTHGMNGMAH
jgi:hypothetical protein